LGVRRRFFGAGLKRRQLFQDLLANALARRVDVIGQ
jgi:hypothetical protein